MSLHGVIVLCPTALCGRSVQTTTTPTRILLSVPPACPSLKGQLASLNQLIRLTHHCPLTRLCKDTLDQILISRTHLRHRHLDKSPIPRRSSPETPVAQKIGRLLMMTGPSLSRMPARCTMPSFVLLTGSASPLKSWLVRRQRAFEVSVQMNPLPLMTTICFERMMSGPTIWSLIDCSSFFQVIEFTTTILLAIMTTLMIDLDCY